MLWGVLWVKTVHLYYPQDMGWVTFPTLFFFYRFCPHIPRRCHFPILFHHSPSLSWFPYKTRTLPPSPCSLSLTHTHLPRLRSAIIGPCAGWVVAQPERLIAFLPPAVYTSVLTATPIHYLPWSGAAHSSPLSATSSFTVWTPSGGAAPVLSKTRLLLIQIKTGSIGSWLNPTAGVTFGGIFLPFFFSLVGTCLCWNVSFFKTQKWLNVIWERVESARRQGMIIIWVLN